jgi:hypothetical protein
MAAVLAFTACSAVVNGIIEDSEIEPLKGKLDILNISEKAVIHKVQIIGVETANYGAETATYDVEIEPQSYHTFVLDPRPYVVTVIETTVNNASAPMDVTVIINRTVALQFDVATGVLEAAPAVLRVSNQSGEDITAVQAKAAGALGSTPLAESAIKSGKTKAFPLKADDYVITVERASGDETYPVSVADDEENLLIVTAETTPPAEVTGLAATPGAGNVKLTWTNPVDLDFDHIEITYSDGAGLVTLPDVTKPVVEKIIENLKYGTSYIFIVRTVDTTGNKSLGSPVTAALDKVVTDLDLAQYITAPVAGAMPDTRAIRGSQYTGAVNWRRVSPSPGPANGIIFAELTIYKVEVTLTANAGYTFAGLSDTNAFTYGGAAPDGVVTKENGRVDIDFPALDKTWYVANYGKDDDLGNYDGSTELKALLTVDKALALIATAHNNGVTGIPGATIVVIGTSGDLKTVTRNETKNGADTYPPITLRGLGPTQPGILTADKTPGWTGTYRVLLIQNGAEVTLGNNLTITGGGKRTASVDTITAPGVLVQYNSTFTMNGGTITGNTTVGQGTGGGVRVHDTSTFIMNSGIISNNYGVFTGGVAVTDS